MKCVIQRVAEASVHVDGSPVGHIGRGLLVFLGVMRGDEARDADDLLERVLTYRVFEDDAGKMNRSLIDTGFELLVVSQFTLAADGRKGRRPSFDLAAPPDHARSLYERFVRAARERGVTVATGSFGAFMDVRLHNEGPATFLLESRRG